MKPSSTGQSLHCGTPEDQCKAIMNESQVSKHQFHAFPYEPYDIQVGFMRKLYDTIDSGGIGLFESPTGGYIRISILRLRFFYAICFTRMPCAGTGKTMSLICGSLHWLEDYRKRDQENTVDHESDDDPEWMKEFAKNLDSEKRKLKEKARLERLERGRETLMAIKRETSKRNPNTNRQDAVNLESDDEFLIGNKENGIDTNIGSKRLRKYIDGHSSSEEETENDMVGKGSDEEVEKRTQIIFVSRTHSQLAQFVGELKKTRFHPSISVVSLGSRKQLCINPDVTKFASPAIMNERCMDLQNSSVRIEKSNGKYATKKTCKCVYLKRGSQSDDTMKDMILSEPMDIEDLAVLGQRRLICPYYASRDAAAEADIILAPYSSLLVAETRVTLGLNVQDNVIIVDEAHNLVDAINNSHSACLNRGDLEVAICQIEFYFNRFKARLASRNAKTVQILLLAAQAILQWLNAVEAGDGTSQAEVSGKIAMDVNKFLLSVDLDNMNMFQLRRDIQESNLLFKMGGYWKNAHATVEQCHGTGSLQALVEFLKKLTYDNNDGRIILDRNSSEIKYVMLNAGMSFRSIVDQARSVILASGTLSPVETVLPLFPQNAGKRIQKFKCGHVMDSKRLLAMAIPSGPGGNIFDFRHSSRNHPGLIADLGRTVINISNVTPGGLVVFFPSFAYCDQVVQAWSVTGILDQMKRQKDVYIEPRSTTDVDSVLSQYAKSIQNTTRKHGGAIILAVVGAKLAEGINFGDDMGRCVMMVGLPYPNPSDPELMERIEFMDRQNNKEGARASQPSKEYYTNLCMKAVNQCIGRAIRHIDDYACILLLDQRYSGLHGQGASVVTKLPEWIIKSLDTSSTRFGEAMRKIAQFFKSMQQ